MAKRAVRKERRLSRGQLSRREREERGRRLILAGLVVVFALVAAVLAFGYYQENFAGPSRPVALVRGQAITVRDYQERLRYHLFWLGLRRADLAALRAQPMATGEAGQLSGWIEEQLGELDRQEADLPLQLVEAMVDDLLILQAAEWEGVPRPTPGEIEEEVQVLFGGGSPQPSSEAPSAVTATLPLTATPAARSEEEVRQVREALLARLQRETGLGEDYFKARLGEELLRRRMREKVGGTVEPVAEQVQVRHILLDSREKAEEVLGRLGRGEDFAALAKELSGDVLSAEQGGDLGWFPQGVMEPAFEEAAFGLPVGEFSQAVETPYGFHIVQVLGRERRPLEEAMLADLREMAFYEWLQAEREAAEIERFPVLSLPTPRQGV